MLAEMTPVVVPELVAFVVGIDLGTGFGEVFGIGEGDVTGVADGVALVAPPNGSRASFEVTVSRYPFTSFGFEVLQHIQVQSRLMSVNLRLNHQGLMDLILSSVHPL